MTQFSVFVCSVGQGTWPAFPILSRVNSSLIRISYPLFQMTYEIFSWNAEGLAKYVRNDEFTARISSADILCIQESLALEECDAALISGFVAHSVPAVRTGGRPSGGLSTFFRTATFGAARITRLPFMHSAFLASRILPNDANVGLTVINVYVPAHDGNARPEIYEDLTEHLIEIRTAYPDDALLVLGNLIPLIFILANCDKSG